MSVGNPILLWKGALLISYCFAALSLIARERAGVFRAPSSEPSLAIREGGEYLVFKKQYLPEPGGFPIRKSSSTTPEPDRVPHQRSIPPDELANPNKLR